MPLVGLVDGERTVSCVVPIEDWSALKKDVRAKRRAVVLPCGYAGHLKTSKLGTQYFAHNPGGDGCSAGETAQHLLAKSLILATANAAGWHAEPEVAGDGWVADVMATQGAVRVVFEVQWSQQGVDDYWHRQRRYREAGIASIAWFARHTDGLPAADSDLPIFSLTIDDDGEATVDISGTRLQLTEVVERLLTRRLQHRRYLANGRPAVGRVDGASVDCYRCKKPFGVWSLERVGVQGSCGRTAQRGRPVVEPFPAARPESDPRIMDAGTHLAKKVGVKRANLARRRTQASGTTYMAFTCPHCGATSGEMFIRREFGAWDNHGLSTAVDLPPTAVQQAHWCIAGNDGACLEPSDALKSELARIANADVSHTLTRVAPIHVPPGLSIPQAVARMFGGYGR